MSTHTEPCPGRGALVSIEGLNGVGKTYLTHRLLNSAPEQSRPVVVEEFSQRHHGTDLGRQLLRALVEVSGGDRFLRGGRPRSETLLLIAVKLHDFEATLPALRAGRTVIEGRSAHSVAVYQALILEPDDSRAVHLARRILATTATWRPLPDLTVLITDDPTTAVRRAETRDHITYSPQEWALHHRAAALFPRLALDDPAHVRTIDRRAHDPQTITDTIAEWISAAPLRSWTRDTAVVCR